jgi:hypothetical protein
VKPCSVCEEVSFSSFQGDPNPNLWVPIVCFLAWNKCFCRVGLGTQSRGETLLSLLKIYEGIESAATYSVVPFQV